MADPSRFEFLWKRYEHDVLLHRSYLDLIIKLNLFYYAVTGAILSFYFVKREDEIDYLVFSLLLPISMSASFAIFFFRSAFAAKTSHDYIMKLCDSMGYEVYSAVAYVLCFLLWIFFFLMCLSTIGLVFLFFIDLNICAKC